MRHLCYLLYGIVLCNSLSAQYLSDSGLVNSKHGQYVFDVKTSTDGANRHNSYTGKWVLQMYDYAGGNNGYYNTLAKNTSLLKGGICTQNAIGTTYMDGPWEWG